MSSSKNGYSKVRSWKNEFFTNWICWTTWIGDFCLVCEFL